MGIKYGTQEIWQSKALMEKLRWEKLDEKNNNLNLLVLSVFSFFPQIKFNLPDLNNF